MDKHHHLQEIGWDTIHTNKTRENKAILMLIKIDIIKSNLMVIKIDIIKINLIDKNDQINKKA